MSQFTILMERARGFGWNASDVGIYGDYAITVHINGNLRIWDINAEKCVKDVKGYGYEFVSIISVESEYLLTVETSGSVVIWSIEAMLAGRPAAVIKVSDPSDCPEIKTRCCRLYSLGRNFFVRLDPNKSVVKVTDFL